MVFLEYWRDLHGHPSIDLHAELSEQLSRSDADELLFINRLGV